MGKMPKSGAKPSATSSPSSAPSSSSCCTKVLKFVALAAPFVAYYLYGQQQTDNMAYDEYLELIRFDLFPLIDRPKNPTFVREVTVGDEKILATLLRGETRGRLRPYVFLESVVASWEARNWDLWNLTINWHTAHGVLSASSPSSRNILIQYEKDKGGMIGSVDGEKIQSHLFVDFLHHSRSAEASRMYLTEFDAFENATGLEADTTWRDLLVKEPLAEAAGIDESDVTSPYLWVMYANTALQARYSAYHIMKAQIRGRSHITLFAPEYSSTLLPFPSIHVSHAQSQLVFNDLEANSDKRVIQVILEPGHLLYIPPFWYFRQRSLDTMSLGIDVMSASMAQLHLLEAFYMPLPFLQADLVKEGDTAEALRNRRVVASQVYLMHFLSRLRSNTPSDEDERNLKPLVENPKAFLRELYEIRYAQIFSEESAYMQMNSFRCLTDGEENQKAYREILETLITPEKEKEIKTAAAYAAACVNEQAVENSVKIEWTFDYLEQLARWAMGSPDEAVFYLRECLNFDSILHAKSPENGGLEVEVEGPQVMVMDGGSPEDRETEVGRERKGVSKKSTSKKKTKKKNKKKHTDT